ncbi:MAG: Gfo/Idh/MocA family oxidoreductase [Paracoccaceae bacterium]|nr:Gfo/Idh/MocA family oxidoreductase [Paracoccaceae bacterium]
MALGIALAGIGKIARDQHIPSIAKEPGFTLAATASRNPEATVNGVEAFPSLDALLSARPDIPAVSLATPPQARFADAHLALSHGKHVMLEKPPGATLTEVHTLEALARDKGVSLFATWHSREAAAVDAAHQWLRDRTLTRVDIQWKEDVRHWHPGQEWIWEAGGLGVFDPGINALSVMTAILPTPVHLTKARLDFPSNRDTPVAAALRFQGSDEAEITAEFDWLETGPPKWTIDIETSEGAACLSGGGARFEAEGVAVAGADEEYARLYKRFADLIEAGEVEVDLAPMRHVADAFTLGRRVVVDAFDW